MEKQKPTQSPEDKMQKLVAEAPLRWLDATGIILGTVALIGGAGYYLDRLLHTKPWLLIAGIVVAFPVSQYFIYTRLKKRYQIK